MKKGFTLKLTTLLFTLALSFALAFAFYGAKPAFAASVTSPSAYFSGTYQSLEFKDDNLVATVKTGNTLSFNNSLVIDDFEMQLVVPSEIKEVKITLNLASGLLMVIKILIRKNKYFEKQIKK